MCLCRPVKDYKSIGEGNLRSGDFFFFLRSGGKKNRLIAGYEEGQIDNMHV